MIKIKGIKVFLEKYSEKNLRLNIQLYFPIKIQVSQFNKQETIIREKLIIMILQELFLGN